MLQTLINKQQAKSRESQAGSFESLAGTGNTNQQHSPGALQGFEPLPPSGKPQEQRRSGRALRLGGITCARACPRHTPSAVTVRRALDLEKSAAIQRFNVYFTRHFLSMDSKTHNQTNTTGVAINILTSIMSGVQPGWSDKPCARLRVCVCTAGEVCANSCDGSRCEELACH